MKTKYYIMLIVAAMIWGTSFISSELLLNEGIPPLFILGVRFFVASIGLFPFIIKNIHSYKKDTYVKGVSIGSVFFLGFAFTTIGLRFTSVPNNAFITSTYVIIVPFLYWILYKRRPSLVQFIAVFVSIFGIRLLGALNTGEGIRVGDFFSLISAFFFAAHLILMGNYINRQPALFFTFIQMITASLLSFLISFAFEPFPQLQLSSIFQLVYLGVVCSLISNLFQNIAQKYISPITVSLILSTEAVFATLLSIIILGEVLSLRFIIGATLILVAIFCAEIKFNARK